MSRRLRSPIVDSTVNDWNDSYPQRQRINSWTVSTRGIPTEVWILYVEPVDLGRS